MITPLPPVLVKPLLNPRCNQYCALPVEDPKLWAFYKRHITSFWTPEEINLSDDMKHHPNLPPDQLHFLSVVLSFFFAISDKIVANNLSQNFMTEVTSLEAQFFLWFSTHDGKHPQ
jgi:ribonucleotide reductase beta subunit family protein with ferritin-like domain